MSRMFNRRHNGSANKHRIKVMTALNTDARRTTVGLIEELLAFLFETDVTLADMGARIGVR
jgi:hypothetical protein